MSWIQDLQTKTTVTSSLARLPRAEHDELLHVGHIQLLHCAQGPRRPDPPDLGENVFAEQFLSIEDDVHQKPGAGAARGGS
jgi:hypothetical protein